jgi:hypothetical protein
MIKVVNDCVCFIRSKVYYPKRLEELHASAVPQESPASGSIELLQELE